MTKTNPAPAADTPAATVPALFDLGSITAVNTGTLTVLHPVTGEPTNWTITLAGPEHPVTEAISDEIVSENDARQRQQEQARVNGKKWKAPDEGEAARKKTTERLARRILGWTPVTFDGVAFDYNAINAFRLVDEGKFLPVAKQVIDFLNDDASFTKRSAKT